MKTLPYAIILFFAFCFSAFGQTNDNSPCPNIQVTGPPVIAQPNEPIVFTVSMDEKAKNYDIKYKWAISSGKIVDGQETQTLTVMYENLGETITATVEISGLPGGCENTASEVYMYCVLRTLTVIDEFTEAISQIDGARIDAITEAVKNDPTAQLYVISRFMHSSSQQEIDRRKKEIARFLMKAGIEKDRITLVQGVADKESTQFVLVPAGAEPPKID
jgi:hypothetical protein